MVHSTFAQGHVMGGRDTSLGIPKSPSFHSGLDLVASASVDSLVAAQTSVNIENETNLHNTEINGNKRTANIDDNKEFSSNVLARFEIPRHKNESVARVMQFKEHLPSLAGDYYVQSISGSVAKTGCTT